MGFPRTIARPCVIKAHTGYCNIHGSYAAKVIAGGLCEVKASYVKQRKVA